jgi:ribulose-5-phosphate 4-epimerase/fuculose-1-phosphate aldolase
LLDPLTQDSCKFYDGHALFGDFTGVVLDTLEGDRIAEALGPQKAVIPKNHGFLTVGASVKEAA